MTNEQLAALSEAATQERADRENYMDGCAPIATAVLRYHAMLERLHRTGKLVYIGDDAVDRVGMALCQNALGGKR